MKELLFFWELFLKRVVTSSFFQIEEEMVVEYSSHIKAMQYERGRRKTQNRKQIQRFVLFLHVRIFEKDLESPSAF